MSHSTEFPDFCLDIEIPANWEDVSWHNDACPSWRVGQFRVWIDYANSDMRECDGARFALCDLDTDDALVYLETDNWAVLLDELSFRMFQVTGYDCPDIRKVVQDDLYSELPVPGRIYCGSLFVEKHDANWYLIVERSEFEGPYLEPLERHLWRWADRNIYDGFPRRPVAAKIAEAFAEQLRLNLRVQIHDVIARNREEVDSSVCHSHDFCDANVYMESAFEEVIERNICLPCDIDDGRCTQEQVDRDLQLWDDAWNIAKINNFWAE